MKANRLAGRTLLALLSCLLLAPGALAQPTSWKSITLTGAPDLSSICFADRDRGWVVGLTGEIFYTENGGRTAADWHAPNSNPAIGTSLWKVYFLSDGLHGWAVGDSGVIVRTVDGGKNWQLSNYTGGLSLRSVYFLNASVGVASATSSNRVLHSNDGGVNWTPVVADENAYDLVLATASSGYSVEPTGGNAMEYDGSTWTWMTPGPGVGLYALALTSPTSFLAVGANGNVLRYNSGQWRTQVSGVSVTLNGVALARTDPRHGFAVGVGGVIIHTDRADLEPSTWSLHDSGVIHTLYGVAAESSDRAWAAGNFGTVLIFPACLQDVDCTGGQFVDCSLDYGRCDPVSQTCGAVADGHPCDDGDACTENDACGATGTCQPGTARSCDDGNVCTDDGCDPTSGCTHANNSSSCDDGDACTEGDRCAVGACQPGTARSCDDGNVCTDDGCDPASGCTHANNSSSCDDGDACTENDRCQDGSCRGSAIFCDDGLACTSDRCDGVSGECVYELRAGFCLIEGNCRSDGARAPANDCLACDSARRADDWSELPDDTPCGACLLCGAGVCGADPQNRPPVGSDCDDGDECTPRGRCNENMVCVIEGRCDEFLSDECRAASRPEARYGLGEGETLDCRFDALPLSLSVNLEEERAAAGKFFFATVRARNLFGKSLYRLRLVLDEAAVPGGLRYVSGSARWKGRPAPVERIHGGSVVLEWAAPPEGLAAAEEGEVTLWLVRPDGGGDDTRLLLGAWIPCAAPAEDVGCHAGARPEMERTLGAENMQRIAEAVALPAKVGEYRAGDGGDRPDPGGCTCGGFNAVALGWIWILPFVRRRRRT
jgi:photosystem II stability/assembly factor-like uncharacterized protein